MRQNPYSPFVKIGGVAKIIDAAGYIKCTFHCSFKISMLMRLLTGVYACCM